MNLGDRRIGFLVAAVALLGAAAGLAYEVWSYVMDSRAIRISAQLAAQLPQRLAQWSDAIAAGASRTCPSDFPSGASGDSLLEWAFLGAAVMDRESLGATALTPANDWNGTGDGGNASTPWQLDKRYHAKYLARTDRTPATDSAYAMNLLAASWRAVEKHGATDDDAIRDAADAYNASQSKVLADIDAGTNPDELTTGGDYGSDVLGRFTSIRSA